MNELPFTVKNTNIDLSNPVVAVTILGLAVVAGMCYCATITVNAKYNRDVELNCGKFSLTTHSSAPAVSAVPA